MNLRDRKTQSLVKKVDLVEGTPLAKAGGLGDLGMQRTAGGYREQQGSTGSGRLSGWAAA